MLVLFATLAVFILVAPLLLFGIQYLQFKAYQKKRDAKTLSAAQQNSPYASAHTR